MVKTTKLNVSLVKTLEPGVQNDQYHLIRASQC